MNFERSRRHQAEQDTLLEITRRGHAEQDAMREAAQALRLEAQLRNAENEIDSKDRQLYQLKEELEDTQTSLEKSRREQQATMDLMAEWMVSQKAFKELAINFGFDANGYTPEQVIDMGDDKKFDVLDNKHNKEHGTNANGIPLIEENKEKLRPIIKKKIEQARMKK